MKSLPGRTVGTLALILTASLIGGPVSSQADQVVSWGDNFCGQTNVPPGLTNVVAIAAGARHCVALEEDGTVVAWGWQTTNGGQLAVPQELTNGKLATIGSLPAPSHHCAILF